MSPEATRQLIETHQKTIIVFSDSTLRLGRVGHREPTKPWTERWNSHSGDLHYERFNIYGQELTWEFEIKTGATTIDLIKMLKHDVDAHGGISRYHKRVIIIGALNELAFGARDQNDPLRPHELLAAANARDFVIQFPFGTIAWIGPGDEKVWSYSIPFKWGHQEGCWNVQAQAFMRILQQSRHVFLNPCFAFSQLRQVKDGKTCISTPTLSTSSA